MKKAIKTRRSIRNYKDKPIKEKDLKKIESYMANTENLRGPFDNTIGLKLVQTRGGLSNGRIGTYGVIKNAPMYLISICENERTHILDSGYILEKLILYCESLNIGTCWLGGTFSRKNLGLSDSLKAGEIIPAITPIGYKADKNSLTGMLVERMANSKSRKAFDELFFYGDFNTAISDSKLKKHLELVRIGPSASNKQPWRILIIDEVAHFYIERTPKYVGNKFGYDMQLLDMGIAFAHYEVGLGRPLDIFYNEPSIVRPNDMYEYIGSVK